MVTRDESADPALHSSRSHDIEEATPDWSLDFEMSYVGDIRGTGDDVIRIIERNVHADPDRVLRRARHYDVRTGALIGTVVFNAPFD